MNQEQADELIEQWELANEWLEHLEGREKENTFDLMLEAAISLSRAGFKLTPDNHWYYYPSEAANEPQ